MDAKNNKLFLPVLLIVNIALRLSSIGRDLPPYAFCDEEIILPNAFRMLRENSWFTGTFLSGGLNFYVPTLVARGVEFLSRHSLDYREFILLSRFVMPVALSSLATVFTYLGALRLFGDLATARWTAALMTLSPMALGLSRYVYPDHWIVFFASLVLWASVNVLNSKVYSNRYFLLGSVFVGFAASVKYYGILLFLTLWTATFKKGQLKAIFQKGALGGCIAAVTFALCNFGIFDNVALFRSDFLFNINHYKWGQSGLESSQPLFYYSQILFLTSFGVLGSLLLAFGTKECFKRDIKKLLLLAILPFATLVIFSRYKVVVGRNLAPTLPFIFIFQALGVSSILRIASFSRLVQSLVILTLFLEPTYKTFASIHNDFKPDSREAASAWIAQNIQKDATVGFSGTCWGHPNPEGYTVKTYPIPTRLLSSECLDYYGVDEWQNQASAGAGNSMLKETIYSRHHFINITQTHYADAEREQNAFLSQYEIVKAFGREWYGPGIQIYKARQPCKK